MAVIGKIRKHSVILLLIVAIALLAFILGDFIKPGNSGLKEFITIDNDEISYYDYMDKYNYYSGLLKDNNAENVEYEANNYTYNEMVDSIILSKQLIPLGISVTAEELNELMAGDNPHPDARRFFGGPEGKYDKQIAQGFLANMDQYDSAVVAAYLYWENAIEKQTLLNKYLNMLGKSYYLPKVFARKMQEESEMKAQVLLTHIPYTNELVSDDKIKFTEDDIKQWYEKNLYRFPQDQEMRNIDYVIFEIKPSEQDLQEIENDVRQKYAEFVASAEPEKYINSMVDSRYDSTFFKQNKLPSHIDTLLFNAPIGTW
jgi:peptidyl-prolyl cis-trans isomerase D